MMRSSSQISKQRDTSSYTSTARNPTLGFNLNSAAKIFKIGSSPRKSSCEPRNPHQAKFVSKVLKSTSTVSRINLDVHQIEVIDVDMADEHDANSTTRHTDDTDLKKRIKTYDPSNRHPVVQVCEDGDWIEIGTTSSPLSARATADFERGTAAVRRHFPLPCSGKVRRDHDTSFTEASTISNDEPVEVLVPEIQITENLHSLVASRTTQSAGSQQQDGFGRKLEIPSIRYKNLEIKKGLVVELHSGQFLLIDSVWAGYSGQKSIKGYRLLRDRDCGARLPDQRINELVWVNEVDEQGNLAHLESILYEKKLSSVVGIRQVIFTNQPWDMLSFSNQDGHKIQPGNIDKAEIEARAQLYCRWKCVEVQTRLVSDTDSSISLLKYEDAKGIGGLESSELRKIWGADRAANNQGGRAKVFNVDTQETEMQMQYTFGDCFCGAGGVSRGAVQAGVNLAWAFDKDTSAIRTHRKNFQRYGTNSMNIDDAEMIQLIKEGRFYCDIMHCSPPCQPFSPANRHTNLEMDEANQQVLFSLQQMTQGVKPRIVTIEETAGLMNRHGEWFDTLINIFTSLGYSVRWKMVRCKDYGVPQSRVRLFLIAAAPGETLPRFPAATHGEPGSRLKPFVKIRDVIDNISPGSTHQNMFTVSKNLGSLRPFSGDSFASCITTSGGDGNHHPSGKRHYSVRELAMLQCFPQHHDFSFEGIGIAKRQVGNAVPPPVAEAMFREVLKSLRETDGI